LSLVTRLRRTAPEDRPAEADPVETGPAEADPVEAGPAEVEPAEAEPPRGRARAVGRVVLTALAAVVVAGALVAPDDYSHLRHGAFVGVPLEALVAVALLVVLPRRPRHIVAVLLGVLLGLLSILKVVDIGFTAVLARPFDLVLDWILLADATGVVEDSIGRLGAVLAVVGAGLLVIAILVVTTLAVLRLTRLVARHDRVALRTVAVLTVAWIACAAAGVQLVGGAPVASRTDASLVYDSGQQIRAGLRDKEQFRQEAAVDPFGATPGSELLPGLRGKDVLLTFVESYGRYAIEDPTFSPAVRSLLDAGSSQLQAAGFGARSGFLSSSTIGGGSWLAHASLLSGLYISNQQRYRTLVSSDRLTLTGAFKKAGWRTVSVEPAVDGPWPEGAFFGYEKDYDLRNLGYQGPRFSYATMPDQYTYSAFQRAERQPGHAPLFGEITTVSSHNPWTPIPKLVDWDKIGDGSIFDDPANREGGPPSLAVGNPTKLRTDYINSIRYSLTALISYLQRYGDKNLVMVFLGDHQPSPVVTGRAGRDVPITIVAKDPSVLAKVSSWNWTPGLRPDPRAPVWRMDTFRNRFLIAYGSTPAAR
jgi:hypothetical protein